MKERGCVILAAGQGTRLGFEDKPKVMAGLWNKPILHHSVETVVKTNPDEIVIVVGYKAEAITRYFGRAFKYQVQESLNGNAEALRVGVKGLDPKIKNILVVQGDDSAFYSPETLFRVFLTQERAEADITVLLTDDFNEKTHRSQFVIGHNGRVLAYQRKIFDPREGAFFTGACCFTRDFLLKFLPKVTPDPTTGEIVIPQLFEMGLTDARKMFSVGTKKNEWVGINTQEELAIAQELMSQRLG